ncbi:uncharacterized protein BDR25DRAFT_323670 [Lindgomyces ingoldianus]|uniref:Uncharacterized protein n=1 Tax=Lindgomyces ingoldianus TaxID=673940 RepID=A0ACB6R176_9PLEO|nr:uncharacterized protein BDR25DRAFT_323670 [Lindgomyces ingoldianus]KAF2473028.1 hypothetical protein BDR25DRAFT_323670 [Lindgomyces ingoldianus]
MAPNILDTAGPSQKRAQRTIPRIIPAVPLALSRAPPSTRPITPEETVAEPTAVSQETQESHLHALTEKKDNDQATGGMQAPLTPESKASAINSAGSEEEVLASSPSEARLHDAEEPLHTRAPSVEEEQTAVDDVSSTSSVEQNTIAMNGTHPTATPPAQFPPPFYPSERSTAQATTYEAAHVSPVHASTNVHSHRPQPSLEGIVFGAAQESPAMPSTPHEAEPEVRPQQYIPRPAPGFASPQFASPFYPGHAHHPSDAAAPWLYPAYTMAPPDALYGHGRDYHAPSFADHAALHGVYQGHLPPRAPVATNGTSHTPKSPTLSPTKSQPGDIGSEHGGDSHVIPFQNGASIPVVDTKLEDTPFELAAYLSSQFGNPEYADYILQIHSDGAKLISLPVHGIVVARSRAIATAIRSATPVLRSKDSRALIDIFISNKTVTAEALTESIKILYGSPLLSLDSFLYGLQPYHTDGEQASTFGEARKRMNQALSYAAAGEVLQLHSMTVRGAEIAKALLRWDTFDQALCLALGGGMPFANEPSSSRHNMTAHNQNHRGTYGSYKTPLLYDVIDWLAYNFPVDFQLFTLAPELSQKPRIPSVVELRHPTHNPRLSKIRFGDVPPEDDMQPTYITKILSSVIFSLPLPVLEYLFNHPTLANRLGWSVVVQVMRATVEERENRRRKALRHQIRPAQDGTLLEALLENLYWEERVESSSEHSSGYKLTENRVTSHV